MTSKIYFGIGISEETAKGSKERIKISFDGTEETKVIFDPTGDTPPSFIKLPVAVTKEKTNLLIKFRNEEDLNQYEFLDIIGNHIKSRKIDNNSINLKTKQNSIVFIKMNTENNSNLSVFSVKPIER